MSFDTICDTMSLAMTLSLYNYDTMSSDTICDIMSLYTNHEFICDTISSDTMNIDMTQSVVTPYATP